MDVEALLLDESYTRYCLGTADAATIQYWETFRLDNPACAPVLEEAAVLINSMYQWGAEQELRQSIRIRSTQLYRWLGAAAAVTVLVVAGYIWLQPPQMIHAITQTGERKKILLPDNTLLILESGTRIQYVKGSRKVLLEEGALYCEVKHDPEHPFTIETSAGHKVIDIGTAFHVSSYPSKGVISVSVKEGTVQIGTTQLHAGETLTLDHNNYSLENVTLHQLLQTLQDCYKVQFVVRRQAIMSCKITTTFSKADPIRDILDNLQLIYGIHYTIRQHEIILDGKGCN
jgi:transmembrane sensor